MQFLLFLRLMIFLALENKPECVVSLNILTNLATGHSRPTYAHITGM